MEWRGPRTAAVFAILLVVVGVATYVGTSSVRETARPDARASTAPPVPGPSQPNPSGSAPILSGTTEPVTTIPFPRSLQLSAPTRDVLWMLVAGKGLFRSVDKGESWVQRPLPPSLPNIEQWFVNEREGFVSSVGSTETQCLSQSIEIWRTADAGSTYARLPGTGIADSQCKAGLAFVDPQRGFISAWSPNGKPVVYRTSDGGRSWQGSQPLPDPPGYASQSGASPLRVGPAPIRAFGSTLLLQAVGNVRSGQLEFVYRSTDGGATWTYAAALSTPTPVGFVTETRWVQLILPRQSRETTDGGATWRPYAADWGQAGPTPPIVIFPDQEVGYTTTSRGGFQRSVDGGLHWTTLRPPGST